MIKYILNIISKRKSKQPIKFINYTGEYPSLCCGVLTLQINGTNYTFGAGVNDDGSKPDFSGFWHSGGGLTHDFDRYTGEWSVNLNELPNQFRKYAFEINKVFNENVEHGCCGGCI